MMQKNQFTNRQTGLSLRNRLLDFRAHYGSGGRLLCLPVYPKKDMGPT